ncbi:MFS transporter [Actinoplanes sp. SE50]|uniref:MFS transporter n=1 Tax=unclassified Actinoplanes TaxID=2626549 RepID=UPI00023EC6F3|nr:MULTISPECIES: MFS transporter [unclassified Actinoplanes]AEV81429.1 major facilitator superfamily MFS_1 [Actinoplanes sp. SE50/110]ATO79832.1 MFS transporter [Actinoplanes sp. SE50]SLL97234.1 MFS transporter [Actinoplanes sp. SE50/110]
MTITEVPVRTRWMVAYALAMIGVAAGWFGPIQILLPEQAARLAEATGGGKEALLALVTAVGAAASLVANPIWGAVSDRMGSRRPIFVAGTVIGVAGLLVLAAADTRTTMIVGWVLVQVGLNGPLAALAAMIGDRVPERQRGTVGALFGVAQIVGVVLGTALAVASGGYLAVAVAVPALGAALLLIHREPVLVPDRTAVRWSALLRPGAPFAWAWLIRFLLNLVNALVLVYLFYYLSDRVGVGDAATWVLILTVVNVVFAGIFGFAGGVLSDRWERRRIFVAAAAVILAAGTVLLALIPVVAVAILASVLVGAGWGAYVAVDMAVITHVLPDAETRATMLGVANIAGTLPQLLAPVIAAPIVTRLGGYPTLYLFTAAVALLALACLPRLEALS